MTTTEVTVSGLDAEIAELDDALPAVRAQHDQAAADLATAVQEWETRAARGDLDDALLRRRRELADQGEALASAIAVNRARRDALVQQRTDAHNAVQLAADRKTYLAELATFTARPDAETLIQRLLDTTYAAVRATRAELAALHAEQERLSVEARRHVGVASPPAKTAVDFAPDRRGSAPNQLMASAMQLGAWAADRRTAEVVADHLVRRMMTTARDDPNEPVPAWPTR